jgi:NAD(P)H-flavin reductase
VLLTVDASGAPALVKSHTTPGQYVKAAFFDDDVARPYALCNRPGTKGKSGPVLEFLLKQPATHEGDARSERLLALTSSDRVSVSPAQGKGFPVDAAKGRPLWLFGVGSGIAPLKAVVDAVVADRSAYGDVQLAYGVRDAAELAFRDRFAQWAGLSVRVVPVVSRVGEGSTPWDGRVGRVQDHLPPVVDAASTHVFVCGLPEMEKAVTAAVQALGVRAEHIHRNW